MKRFLPLALLSIVGLAIVAGILLASRETETAVAPDVALARAPDDGLQPQVAVDDAGRLHLLYFAGDAPHGDLFYVQRDAASVSFSRPIRVNSRPGTAVATGTMRGGQLAIGRDGRLHVAWQGSTQAADRMGGKVPIFYTRLNEARTGFEAERNVVTLAATVDGVGLAADRAGHVYVAWHAMIPGGQTENDRRLWVARSSDDGVTFAPEAPVSPPGIGACECCGVRAIASRPGTLYVLFRSARDVVNRDTYLLTSRDQGASFSNEMLQAWNVGACPMSTFALAEHGNTVLAAWETGGQVQWLRVDQATGQRSPTIAPSGSGENRKYPAIAANSRGEVMLAWTEGTSWSRGGSVEWQRFAADGTPMGPRGHRQGVPAFSLVAVVAGPDDGFTIFY